MNTKNFILILLLLLILITSGCGGGGDRNGTKPKPPEEIVEPAPPPIVVPNPPDNGSDPVPPDDNDENPCETGERQYHYDDGRETGVDAFKYPQCTYYAAKTFQNLAPEPGVNWGGNAGAWYKNAGENGWVTTNIKDDSRLVPGSIIVWGNHVQMVSDVFSDGIIVVGMNEGWSNEHDPLDPKHDKHSVGSYTNDNGKVITVYAYTGYVYRYCIPFDDFDSQSIYWGGPFRGYVLPIRQSGDVLGIQSQTPFTSDEIDLKSLGVSFNMGKEQILAKLGQPLRIERYEDIYGSEELELFYDGYSIGLYEGSYSGYTIFSKGIGGIRDLQVGDTVEKVLVSFLKTNDVPGEWINPDAIYWSYITSNCVELYFIGSEEGPVKTGSYHCEESSGEIVSISYSDYIPGSCAHSGVTFDIENGLVKRISCGY